MEKSLIKTFLHNPQLATVNTDPAWKGTPADNKSRFINLYHPYYPGLRRVIRWQLQANPFKKQKKKEYYLPEVFMDNTWLYDTNDTLVWMGHSTFYLRINGVRIMIDPVFGNVSIVKRKSPMPVNPALFSGLDYILLSHDHRDHLDKTSLQLLAGINPGVKYLAGLGMGKLVCGITRSNNIQEAGWYQQFDTGEETVKISFIPSRHWSRRLIFDTNKRLWGGFVIEAKGKRIFFAGDSGYDEHFKQIGKIFGDFDYSIIGIGAYEPKWFMHPMHQSPDEALKAFSDMKSTCFIPMHYGTFDLSDEPMEQPLKDLKEAAVAREMQAALLILDVGKPLSIL